MFAKLFAVSFLTLPFVRFALAEDCTLAEDCARSYTVKAGDFCDSISAANNVSTYQLATVNAGIIDATCSNLQVGESICLGFGGNEDCATTYVVAAGDTCEGIASTFAINTTILYENNPNIDRQACSNIYSGEVLCVSSSVQVPPAAAPPASSTAVSIGTTSASATSTVIVSIATPSASATSSVLISIATASASATSSVHVSVATTSASATSSASAASTTSTSDEGEGDDDDDIPYCDEL